MTSQSSLVRHFPAAGRQSGFTFVEVAVVISLITLVTAFSIPRMRYAVERTRAAEAIQFLSDVRFAQERHEAALGEYARDFNVLELTAPIPESFKMANLVVIERVGRAVGWSLTLSRKAESSALGTYTVTFSEAGYDSDRSTLSGIPEISPLDGGEVALLRP